MADESEHDESGSTLRQKLEAALKDNQKLADMLGTTKASEVIREKGLTMVKPEDLKGIPIDDLEARAEAVQKERQAFFEDQLRAVFQSQGVTDEEALTARVQALLGAEAAQDIAQAGAYGRVQQVSGGTPAPLVNPNQLHGREAIAAALAAKKK